jgi:hypothetical protein
MTGVSLDEVQPILNELAMREFVRSLQVVELLCSVG